MVFWLWLRVFRVFWGLGYLVKLGVSRGTGSLGFRRGRVLKVKGWGSSKRRASRFLRSRG